jgi:stearoyl-CoA desaturase (Delta-9 desaturase)
MIEPLLNDPKVFKTHVRWAYFSLLTTTLSAILATVLVAQHQLALFYGYLWLGAHLLGMLGITVGFHRLASHKSFSAKRPLTFFILILGCMGFQGPITHWASNHRRHHATSDSAEDLHSPFFNHKQEPNQGMLAKFWYAHVGWIFCAPLANPNRYCRDLLTNPDIQFIDKHYFKWILAGLILPGVIALSFELSVSSFCYGVLSGGLLRIFTVYQGIWLINSWCHLIGKRAFDTRDNSRNSFLWAIPTAGESWHNNHHAYPSSARFGFYWWQIDLGYLFILLFKSLGMVTRIARPAPSWLERKSLRE